jgi:molybdopterin/thiamine biosynthesis adenylyltransferase
MPPAASRDVKTLHQAELETFTTELIAAGFRPDGLDRTSWIGPVHPCLARLSESDPTEMRIALRDGWPYQHPYIFVDGLVGRRHVNPAGNVCLWEETDPGYDDWRSVAAIYARIEAWCADQEAGAPDLSLDPHLYFTSTDPNSIVLIDIEKLERDGRIDKADGAISKLRATCSDGTYRVSSQGSLATVWFWRDSLPAPPADLGRIEQGLTAEQSVELVRMMNRVRPTRPCLVLLGWNEAGTDNVMALRLEQVRGEGRTVAIELARSDTSIMILRSGPDAELLMSKHVAIFGVGAIGSEIAILLARSGTGTLTLFDSEKLRPGNLTRHASAGRFVGLPKVEAMKRSIQGALPHVIVLTVDGRAWDPAGLAALMSEFDLLVDATGNAAFTDMLSAIANTALVPLISVALFRSGAIAMVDIQPAPSATPVATRRPENGYAMVPAGAEDAVPLGRETGCGAPISNAPPWAVASAASLGVQAAADAIAGRATNDERLFNVLQPIGDAPFHARGLARVAPNGG